MHATPLMSQSALAPVAAVEAIDEHGAPRESHIAGELPLTIYVDKREIVTLMTLGTQPEALVLGYLRNQGFVQSLSEIRAVQVDWETESAAVTTVNGIAGWEQKLAHRTVTTGCGQGTVFGNQMERLDRIHLAAPPLRQSTLYALLDALAGHNTIYRQAGGVHGCALCTDTGPLLFVEDVGRHNAVDAIAGHMWMAGMSGGDKLFYTTGRLTSEMVMKVAQMAIPILLSRSGVTQMGLALARKLGVTLIARARGRHFLVYNGAGQVEFDARPLPAMGEKSAAS